MGIYYIFIIVYGTPFRYTFLRSVNEQGQVILYKSGLEKIYNSKAVVCLHERAALRLQKFECTVTPIIFKHRIGLYDFDLRYSMRYVITIQEPQMITVSFFVKDYSDLYKTYLYGTGSYRIYCNENNKEEIIVLLQNRHLY